MSVYYLYACFLGFYLNSIYSKYSPLVNLPILCDKRSRLLSGSKLIGSGEISLLQTAVHLTFLLCMRQGENSCDLLHQSRFSSLDDITHARPKKQSCRFSCHAGASFATALSENHCRVTIIFSGRFIRHTLQNHI